MDQLHIHTPGDGRGPREVFVNSKIVKGVIFADERRGIVRAIYQPIRLDKYKKRLLSYVIRGEVRVKPKAT